LLRTWELPGGVSGGATALELRHPDGETAQFVVRRHQRAAAEFRLLGLLHDARVPVPDPCLARADYIVTAFIEGEPGTQHGDPATLATTLAALHRTDWTGLDLSFLPHLSSRNDAVLLHGDFWPGNTLWRDGELVALIDWEDAAVGDPLVDLANGRLEVLFAFGEDAMDEFTHAYRAAMPELDYADLPQWDLYAVRRLVPELPKWGLDPAKEEELRHRAEWFAARRG
jgi:aminoglycoside phosphotransferase (APT) family kinase protein